MCLTGYSAGENALCLAIEIEEVLQASGWAKKDTRASRCLRPRKTSLSAITLTLILDRSPGMPYFLKLR